MYDRERENSEFVRSILTDEERGAAEADVEETGFLAIARVRELVSANSIKGDTIELDPELMMLIDARINYKIFVASDNVYTREELYASFPFHELNVQPEAIFVQQEIGVFPPRKYAIKDTELEYVARDAGDASVEFVMIEDLVGQASREGYTAKRAPLKIAKTKIFIGKEQWGDFLLLQRVFRGVARVAHAQIAYGAANGGAPGSPLLALFGARPAEPPLLVDQATLEAEKQARANREAELRRREEEQRRREEEHKRVAEEAQRRIDADLKRIEGMLAAVSQMRDPASPGPNQVPSQKLSSKPLSSDQSSPSGSSNGTGPDDDSVAI